MPQTYAGERATNPSTAGQVLVDVCYLKPQVTPEHPVLKVLWELILLRIACVRIKTVHKARPILRTLVLKARYRQIYDPHISDIYPKLIDHPSCDRRRIKRVMERRDGWAIVGLVAREQRIFIHLRVL